jgi:ribosomal-protein-alanine N-acetyltransferase
VHAFIEKINKGIDNKAAYYWAITLNETKELVGTFCIWNLSGNMETGEIGYELLPAFQGKGLMKEAMSLVLNFIFDELQMKTIEAFTHKDNASSNKLLASAGFKLTDRKDADNKDLLIYTLFKH